MKKGKATAGIVALSVLTLFAAGCSKTDAPVSQPASETTAAVSGSAEETKEKGIYTPGTYSGESQGYGGTVTVAITVDADMITEVTITGDQETETVGGAALAELAQQIKDAQDSQIDGVARATVTSTGVRSAAAAAIAQAKGEEAEKPLLKPGTYEATKEGFQLCHVTVSVTVDEDSITDVKIVECTDHPKTVSSVPCQQIPADIVKYQTYNVDTVTGATVTSNAIRFAVRDCLEQAGNADGFSRPVEQETMVQGEDVYTDVLVVGGGGSGMVAAIEASMGNSIEEASGLNVTLIEKAGFLGGSTSCSGGVRMVHRDETGAYDEAWIEKAVEEEKAILQPYMQMEFNDDLIRGKMSVMQKTNQLLDHVGVKSEDAWGHLQFVLDDYKETKWSGTYLTNAVNSYLLNTAIDLRLNTRAMELLTDDEGQVIGAAVQDKTSNYNIYARKVILACGGFARNEELIEKYAPEFAGAPVFAAGTNTGDGLIMATDIGAAVVGNTMFGHIGCDEIEGQRPDYSLSFYYGPGKAMYVNMNGERFCDETKSKYVIYHDILKQEEQVCWGIVDGDNAEIQALIDSKSQYVHHGETLEELAKTLGMPADALQATVDTYNQSIEQGEDTAFGVAVEQMDRIDTAPYYAFILRPVTLSSLVGLKVDGGCHVLNTNGEAIPNLFAAGDMVLGGNLVNYYFDARGVGTAVYSGDLAAQTAKAEIFD